MKQGQNECSTSSRVIQPNILYFGTPVILLSTLNEDESTNITPMSSAWALHHHVVLGLGTSGHGFANLKRHGECVVNVASPDLWQNVEALAALTGANPVPVSKQGLFRFEKDKFAAAGLSPAPSATVRPDRVVECPLQLECKVVNIHVSGEGAGFGIINVEVTKVHAHERIILGPSHINPAAWSPLIYNFRHYFGLGDELGKTFRAEV